MMSDGRTDPRKDQFIIADELRRMAFERSAKASRERDRAIDGPPELRSMTLDHAWSIQQQASGLFDAAHFVNDLDLERITHAARTSSEASKGADRG